MINRATFRIDELDCAEEVLQLRQEFEGDPAVEQLEFDVVRGQMHVGYDASATSVAEILQRLASLGMHARPLINNRQRLESPSGWGRYFRLGMTMAGILMVLAGFLWQLRINGWTAVLDLPLATRACYLAAVVLAAWFVVPKAWFAIKRFRADMNLLMCIAVCGALLIGQWLEAAVVSVLFSVSLLLEHWSLDRARRAIGALLDTDTPIARCRSTNDAQEVEELPIEQVLVGRTILVRPGERIPLDGDVLKGASSVDQSPITGESMPVACEVGSHVFAGTINGEGLLEVEVTRAADDTTVARIVRLVEHANARRARAELWIERFAGVYTPGMIGLAVLIFLLPPLLTSASWSTWFYNSLVLLVIACPCALVISTPVTIVSALTSAARCGVLIKGGRYLEAAADLQVVAIDKTGTLTYGRPEVNQVTPLNGHSRRELLQRAASLESHSTHPIAAAIRRIAESEGVEPVGIEDYRVLNGRGAEATIAGRAHWIGSRRLLGERLGESQEQVTEKLDLLEERGGSVIVLGSEKHVCGMIEVEDSLRREAAQAIREIKRLGVRSVVMITGDNHSAAQRIAAEAGVDRQFSEALPEEKLAAVERLMREYGSVAMVGDGVNDSPAMAAASLGLAMGAVGTDTAIETADIALMSDDLLKIPWLIRHARRARRVIYQNIAFALGLKLLFVVLTLTGFASLWLAILADTGASLLVVFNGMRLLRSSK